jgi:tetratricopeptide (TPR) repeat protein
MTEPVPTIAPRSSQRTLVAVSLFALIAIPLAIYLNKISASWVPNAERQVQAAKRDQGEQAFRALQDDAAKRPDSAAAQIAYAKALTDRGAFVPALIPAEQAVRAAPDSAEARQLLGDILAPLGYQQDAKTAYEEAIRLDPGDLAAYQHLGDLAAAAGLPAEAERIYREAQKRAPESPGPALSLAQLYVAQAKPALALSTLGPILKSTDPPVAALYMAGKSDVSLGKSAEGIELLRTAVQKQPDFADAYHALGSALANRGQSAEGIAALKRAVELAPANATYHYALANALQSDMSRQDRLNEAQKEFEASLEIDPTSEWAHYYYGVTLEQKGETVAAAREYRRVLELNPQFASAYYRLGLLYRSMGRAAEATKLLDYFDKQNKSAITKVHGERRENSAIDTAPYRYARGAAALRAGKRDMARSEFEAALARDPNYAPAKRDLQRLRAGQP